jgi:hypothetical protein
MPFFFFVFFLDLTPLWDSKIVGMGIIIVAFILSVIAGGLLEARDVGAGCWLWIRLLDCCAWPHGLWIPHTLELPFFSSLQKSVERSQEFCKKPIEIIMEDFPHKSS